jgi:MarR family transcriptional regulator, temperature-dependent positive regulator of motility
MLTDLLRSPGHLFRRCLQLHNTLFAAEIEVTPPQFAALRALEEVGEADQATLAEIIAYDRVTIGGLVDRLESKGLISRRIGKHDRRTKQVRLTDEGRSQLKKIRARIPRINERLLSALTAAEREMLLDLLAKVAAIDDTVAHVGAGVPLTFGK